MRSPSSTTPAPRIPRFALGVLCAVCAPLASAQDLDLVDTQKLSSTAGSFVGPLDNVDFFGRAQAPLGDLDGDGQLEVAISAPFDDDGGMNFGAVYICSLDANGDVATERKISATSGGFNGQLDSDDWFGECLATLGDLDGDGVTDLAVGARNDDDGGIGRGAVWILFLNPDGSVKAHQKISSTEGGMGPGLGDLDNFGAAVASVGDLDGDGVTELAVGAPWDDDGGTAHGAVYVLFLNSNGTVKAQQKISDTEGGFTGDLDDGDDLGNSLATLGDVNGDGVRDLAAGAYLDDDGGGGRGAIWVLFLNSDGTVTGHQKISDTEGGLSGSLMNDDQFGGAMAALGDLDCDGDQEIGVGARLADDGGFGRGAAWVLYLDTDGSVASEFKFSATSGGFIGPLGNSDGLGASFCAPGDLDGDGQPEVMIGATGDDDGGSARGAVYILFLDRGTLGTPYCFGDSGGCPCGNSVGPGTGRGCANSSGDGGRLYATGSLSVAADDLIARADGLLKNQPALLFSAMDRINGGNGIVFGDGLRCAGTGLIRLGTRIPDASGSACWGPGLGAIGGWGSGDTRRAQVWYRDPQGPCGSGFDLTNGLEVVFTP